MEDFERLRERLAAIELDLDAGSYKAGPWQALIDELRARPGDDRASLADEVSRVSRKLHLRTPRKTISIEAARGLELAATLIGCVMLLASLWTESNILAIVGAAVWVTTFQPLLKVAVGRALGVGYDYAYLYGGLEPRFKMNYGSYLAAARPARVLLHLSGTIGSPLAAGLCAVIFPPSMGLAKEICWMGMWMLIATNVIPFAIGFAGIRRVGGWRTNEGSGGAAAIELREAMGLRI
jgi:hypothetical protein